MRPRNRINRRAEARAVKAALTRDCGICFWCHHPGAGQGDHLIPVSLGGDPYDVDNIVAAHGQDDRMGRSGIDYRCPVCNRSCNQERGVKPKLSDPAKPYRSRDW